VQCSATHFRRPAGHAKTDEHSSSSSRCRLSLHHSHSAQCKRTPAAYGKRPTLHA
jgi:hypothetical protein